MIRRLTLAFIVLFAAAAAAAADDVASGIADMIDRAVHEADDVTAASVLDAIDGMSVSLEDARKVLSRAGGLDWLPGTYTRTARLAGRAQEYILYIPEKYDPEKPCGLVIALHGAGGAGHNFFNVWRETADEKNFAVAAPTANAAGRWWSIASDAVGIVLRDILLTVSVDADRVYLTGFSNGGHGAWTTGLREAWRFAGVVPMAGAPTTELLAEDNDFLTNAHATPFYVWHGEKDPVIGIRRAREAVEIMKKRGYPVTFNAVADRGHQLTLTDIPPIGDWMAKQTRKPVPEKIEFYCDRVERGRCAWIRLDEIDGKAFVAASRDENAIEIKTENVKKFSLLLSDKVFDFSKMVIELNGEKTRFDRPEGDVRTLIESVRLYGDKAAAYSAVITVDVKRNAQVDEFRPMPVIESGSRAEQIVQLLVSPEASTRARALISLQRVFASNAARTDPSFRDLGIYIATVMTGDPDPVVRSRALPYISLLGEEEAKKKVTEMMADKSALVRADVAGRITRMMGDDAASMLRVLGGDADAIVRMAALAGLPSARGESKDSAPEGMVKWVAAALDDSDWRVRGAAVDAVPSLKLDGKDSFRLLKPLLEGNDRYLKARALIAASRSCFEEAGKTITAAEGSDDKLLAAMAKQAGRYVRLMKKGIDPGDFERLRADADRAIHAGENEKCIELYLKVLEINPHDSHSQYNLSCAYARLKKIDSALEWLAASILNGYREYDHMKRDPDMDNLRDTEEYESWVEKREMPDPSAAPGQSVPEEMKEKNEPPAPEKKEPEKEPEEKKPKKEPDEEGWR